MKNISRLLGALLGFICVFPALALAGPTSFTSDDFNAYVLNRSLWTWTSPAGYSSLAMVGVNSGNASLNITVDAGVNHDIWTDGYNGARVQQPCTDTSWTAEIKFLSLIRSSQGESYDEQGIVAEQDPTHLIRFDFVTGRQPSSADSVSITAHVFDGGFATPIAKIFKNITTYAAQPTYMRVNRSGSTWTLSYSTDGSAWTVAGTFTQDFNITKIGPWAGNAGSVVRQWTSVVDYFMNTDAPIASEDGATNVADNKAPYIHNVRTVTASNAIVVSWNTDASANGGVNYGTTPSYGNSNGHVDYRYSHLVTLPGLSPSTLYHYEVVGKTVSGPSATTGDNTATTTGLPGTDLSSNSDDFNGAAIDASLWTVSNPKGDATFSQSANRLSIAVPSGSAHDLYSSDTAPKLLQTVQNKDLQFTVKFTSAISNVAPAYQIQGMVFVQDSTNMLRLDFSNSATGTQLLAIGFPGGFSNPVQYLGQDVAAFGASPSYLRVSRSGSYWIVEYSFNGTSWTSLGTFYHVMNLQKAGVWAGNVGTNPPAFTALVDWFKAALPARPALLTPTNAALNVLLPPTTTWDTTTAATTYRLQVASDTSFSSVVSDDSSLVATSSQLNTLSYGTKYFWRVRGKNSTGIGKFSLINSFTTAVQAPTVPVLVSPADNATGQDTASTLKWNKVTGAATYRLVIGTDSTFAGGIFLNDSTVTDSSRVVNGLALGTKYFWHVSAKNSGGTSAFSSTRRFTTITGIPVAPALLAPAASAVDQPLALTLRWGTTEPISLTYHVQVSTDQTFATNLVVDDSTLVDTTKAISGLANSTKYYWRVRGKNASGSGAYSGARDFTTIVAAPVAPVLVAPANGATGLFTSFDVFWQKVATATSYHVVVASDSTFASGIVINDSTVTDTLRLVSGLSYNVKYFWRVSAKNVGGSGPYSQTWNFKTLTQDPTVPVTLSPLNGATGTATALTLQWTRPAGATSFHLQFGIDSLFASTIIDDAAATDTIKNVTGLQFLTKYFWRVNADNIGGTSPYSPVSSFTTGIPLPAQVILQTPAPNATVPGVDSVRLVWMKSTPLVSKYWVQVGVDSLFMFSTIDSNVVDTSYVRHGLTPGQTYHWRVRAFNAGGWGPYSDVRSFLVGPSAVAEPRALPTTYVLQQNYPNPFNPATQIEFAVPKQDNVRLEVYNLLGERVAVLVDGMQSVGYHTVRFDGSNLASGIYLYRLTTGQTTLTRKMILTK
ncbi:MAG: T9SS type A sorting domain-containing protein [Bacteroidota bacterium]